MDNTATFSLLHHINHNPHPITVPRKQSQKLLEKTGIAFVFCSSQSLIFPSITVRDNTFNFRKRCFPEMELPYQTVDLEYRLQLRVSGDSTTFKKRKTFFPLCPLLSLFPQNLSLSLFPLFLLMIPGSIGCPSQKLRKHPRTDPTYKQLTSKSH